MGKNRKKDKSKKTTGGGTGTSAGGPGRDFAQEAEALVDAARGGSGTAGKSGGAAGGAGAIEGLGGPDCNLPTFPVAEWAQLVLLHPSGGQPLDPSLLALAPIAEEFKWNEAKLQNLM